MHIEQLNIDALASSADALASKAGFQAIRQTEAQESRDSWAFFVTQKGATRPNLASKSAPLRDRAEVAKLVNAVVWKTTGE